jgi:hypothetical protein
MRGKQSEIKQDVLELLRHSPVKGAWAERWIQKENAVFQQELIHAGVATLRQALDDSYESRSAMVDNMTDPEQRRMNHESLIRWTRDLLSRINRIAPWADALPQTPRSTQDQIGQN